MTARRLDESTSREVFGGSMWSKAGDVMGKRLVLLAIRLLMSLNLLCVAILLKFEGAPDSVALFRTMSQVFHGWDL
jgi:hypothetical protein